MITSASNPKLKLIRRLASRRQRQKLGLFVCEGEDLVDAGLAAGLEPVELLVAGESVDAALLAELSSLAHTPRVIAVFRSDWLPRLDPRTAPAAGLALWRVADPGNVGTLIRAAAGLGPAFVALSAGCADPLGPKALRASMGAIFTVPLGHLDEAPRPWVALQARGAPPLATIELGERATFLLGAEREGLPPDLVEECDAVASIPLADGAESLNVGAAGAIALYELVRRARD